MIALLDAAVVLGFPALAVWSVRTGGLRRLWTTAGSALAAVWLLALAASSVKFGNRLASQQGYGKTALLTVLMTTLMLGLPLCWQQLSSSTQQAVRSGTPPCSTSSPWPPPWSRSCSAPASPSR
jgi:hypothetical protein